jgi:AcrR family transcriptional regulator
VSARAASAARTGGSTTSSDKDGSDKDDDQTGSGKAPRRTQAERRASSKRRLLDATSKVIAERGTTNVSFAEIAKVARCSHGLPGYLFGSKTNLLLAFVEDVMEGFRGYMLAPAVGTRTGLDALLATMRALLDSFQDPVPYTRAIYVLLGETPGLPAELQTALMAHQDRARQLLVLTILQGKEEGTIRPDVDAESEAVVLFGLLRGIGQQVLLDPSAVDIPSVTDAVLDTAQRALAVTP